MDHKPKFLPLLTPYRVHNRKKKLQKADNLAFFKQKEENILFKPKNLSEKNLALSQSAKEFETRAEFFDCFKKIPLLTRRRAENSTVSVAYLSKCSSKQLSPITMGLYKATSPSINVKNYSMGDNYAEAFGTGLQQHKNLEKLNIDSNNLSPKGTKFILSNIKHQPIKELSLNDNKVDDKTTKSLLGILLKSQPSLRYLNLENTGLTDGDVTRLCEVLANDRMLNFLGLAINSLGINAAKPLSNMLIENHYLKKLDLHWNNFKDLGALILFQGIRLNDSLKELDLS